MYENNDVELIHISPHPLSIQIRNQALFVRLGLTRRLASPFSRRRMTSEREENSLQQTASSPTRLIAGESQCKQPPLPFPSRPVSSRAKRVSVEPTFFNIIIVQAQLRAGKFIWDFMFSNRNVSGNEREHQQGYNTVSYLPPKNLCLCVLHNND